MIDVGADAVASAFSQYPPRHSATASPVYFVDLRSAGRRRKKRQHEFLLALRQEDRLRLEQDDLPVYSRISYEDFTALQSLPRQGRWLYPQRIEPAGEGPVVRVKLKNPSDQLAFQVTLAIGDRGRRRGDSSGALAGQLHRADAGRGARDHGAILESGCSRRRGGASRHWMEYQSLRSFRSITRPRAVLKAQSQ